MFSKLHKLDFETMESNIYSDRPSTFWRVLYIFKNVSFQIAVKYLMETSYFIFMS